MANIYMKGIVRRGLSRQEDITNILWASVVDLLCIVNHIVSVPEGFELLSNGNLDNKQSSKT